MKVYLVHLGIFLTIFGKVHITLGLSLKGIYNKSLENVAGNSRTPKAKSLLSEYLVGIATVDAPVSDLLAIPPPTVTPTTTAKLIYDYADLNEERQLATNPPPPAPILSAVDNIEDAILAALETAARESELEQQLSKLSLSTQKPHQNRPSRVGTNMQNSPGGFGQDGLFIDNVPLPPNFIIPPVQPINTQQGLVNGQLLELAKPEVTTKEPAPGEYIAGIFGSLASANLAGIADNSFKLVASSGVQNFFTGFLDTVTCSLNQGQGCNTGIKSG